MKYLLPLIALILCTTAYAQDPLDGWYFNAAEPGNGFNVNRQAAITGIALFDYTTEGANEWFISVDNMQRNDSNDGSIFEAPLQSFSGGACFDCPFTQATGDETDVFRVEFFDAPNSEGFSVAQVTLRGTTETYIRQIFGFPRPLNFMLGNWIFNEIVELDDGSLNIFADVLQIDTQDTLDDGTQIVIGELLTLLDVPVGATMLTEGTFAGNVMAIAIGAPVDGDILDIVWVFSPVLQL